MPYKFSGFDEFARAQLWVSFIRVLSISLMVPTLIRMHGSMWGTGVISAFLILEQLAVISSGWVREWDLRTLYLGEVLGDLALLSLVPLYMWSPVRFLYAEAFLAVVCKMFISAYRINYDMHLVTRYPLETVKDIRYAERMCAGSALVIGYSSVIVLDARCDTLTPFFVVLALSLWVQGKNYLQHISHITK